jgi:hypothetical protein
VDPRAAEVDASADDERAACEVHGALVLRERLDQRLPESVAVVREQVVHGAARAAVRIEDDQHLRPPVAGDVAELDTVALDADHVVDERLVGVDATPPAMTAGVELPDCDPFSLSDRQPSVCEVLPVPGDDELLGGAGHVGRAH